MMFHHLKCQMYHLAQKHQADTPIGHRCYNFIEMLKNWLNAESDEQKQHLRKGLYRTAREIDALTGVQ